MRRWLPVFLLAGAVLLFMGRPLGFAVALTSNMLGALTPVVYSYVLWARERDSGTDRTGADG